ncbi:MAG TPA: choice-of-anchor tandem repeat GloVer-containing protein [Candidatus Sulfotelmatobacter sp.]|nr:choice-of-anchor tandem repeat GloVer-containing protein [Candidatus Sulfotelmatobacter sp.]
MTFSTPTTDGNFYGTTLYGGNSSGVGTIFKITPQGVLTTLYDFCSETSCADGSLPQAALIQGTDGDFYGTTTSGGQNNNGTVFRFSMGLAPFVKLALSSGKIGQVDRVLGQGFTGTTGVFFNGTPSTFTVISDTLIRTTVPAGATTGFVTVETPGGTLTSNVVFRVIQ